MTKIIEILKKIDKKLDDVFNWIVIIISPLIIVNATIAFYGEIRRANTIADIIIPNVLYLITIGVYGALLYVCINDQRKTPIEQ